MYFLHAVAGGTLLLSALINRQETWKALDIAYNRFGKILSAMLSMVICVSFLPVQTSETSLVRYPTHENPFVSVLFAAVLGSLAMLPGFIAFPLGGLLVEQGGPYAEFFLHLPGRCLR